MSTRLWRAYAQRIGEALSGAIRFAGFAVPPVMMLVCATVAFAQSADDQNGSPTDPVRPVVDVVGVLPDTSGPLLILLVGSVLGVAGAGLAVRHRIAAARR